MNRIKLIVAACFGVASLICALVASTTSYWFELRPIEIHNKTSLPVFARENPFLFTFHLGLFMTCYDNEIPPTAAVRNTVTEENCTVDYDFSSTQIEDFSRSSIVCIVLSDAFILFGCIVCVTAIGASHKGAAFLSGLLFYCAAICSIIGNLTFTARVILQMENMPLPSNVSDRFGWSYFVSWSSLGLQLIAGSCTVSCSSKCTRENAEEEVEEVKDKF